MCNGGTLESITEARELTADQLTHFNWGTTDAEEIQGHLFTDIGCSLRDDSGSFILSSGDEPGLLYVPLPLKLDLALEERHLLRVGKALDQAAFAFSV